MIVDDPHSVHLADLGRAWHTRRRGVFTTVTSAFIEIGDLRINIESRGVHVGDAPIELRPREFDVPRTWRAGLAKWAHATR